MDSSKAVLRLFELIVEQGEGGVSDLARTLGEPKTNVQRGLTTLHEAGWLRPLVGGGRRRWRPSLRLAVLASRLAPLETLRSVALPEMGRLRDATGETVHLTVREGDEVVLIERVDSRQPLRTVRALGARAPLHLTANGKAILAALPVSEAESYGRGTLAAWTPNSVSDPALLAAALGRIRDDGFASSAGEMDPDIGAVGAAVIENGMPVAALSVSGPLSRLPAERVPGIGILVAAAAARIGEALA